MTKRSTVGAVLLLLACLFLASAPAYALTLNVHASTSNSLATWVIGIGAALGLAATATVTYLEPAATAPTTTQASHSPQVVAQVVFGDADTTATITHDFVLSTAQLALLRPWLIVVGLSIGTAYPALSWALNTNTVVCTKGNTSTGSGGTYEVIIERPGALVTSYP
jgi:hypothetical protein